jgi:hypothetical protein
MAVNKNKILYLIFGLTISAPAFAQSEIPQIEVIKFVKNNVAMATKKMGDRIEVCEKQKIASTAPKLDISFLKSIKTKREQLLTGLSHLNFRNTLTCEHNTRMELAYELGILSQVYKHYQLDVQAVKDVATGLIYPSFKEIQLATSYSRLPDNLKQYLEKTISNKQFDLFKMLRITSLE